MSKGGLNRAIIYMANVQAACKVSETYTGNCRGIVHLTTFARIGCPTTAAELLQPIYTPRGIVLIMALHVHAAGLFFMCFGLLVWIVALAGLGASTYNCNQTSSTETCAKQYQVQSPELS
jgi:hypothetical protein